MSGLPVSWWSNSKKEWTPLEKMHIRHLKGALEKLQRGEYEVPDVGLGYPHLRGVTVGEAAATREAILSEYARRGLDEQGNQPEPPPADEGFA